MKSRNASEEKPRRLRSLRGISICWKLAFYLTAFVAVVLVVTFLFQVVLLGTFFRAVKRAEIETTAEELKENLGKDTLEEVAFSAAKERSLGIMLYHMEEDLATQIVNLTQVRMPLAISRSQMDELYQKAPKDGKLRISKMAFGGYEPKDNEVLDGVVSEAVGKDSQRVHLKNLRLYGTQILYDENGNEYLLIITSDYQPLDGTVRVLSMQFFWIFSIVSGITALMVFFLYRRISKPLIRMTSAAQQLARGKYDTDFSGNSGYLETSELAQALNYASQELSKNDKLQKELIANISHDLRTPLTMIKGYGEVMRDLPGENTPENMQVIIDETTRLSELVNDLLDLSKLQADGMKPEVARFNLTEAVAEVMERYEAFTRHKGYTISFVQNKQVWVRADRSMLLQVVYNLINNAINYTGTDLTVKVEQTVHDGRVRISVTDTGEGIPQKEVPYIWDRYYKVDKVHRRAMVGTGLGLSIVKEILEAHGAAYGVCSTLGQGSTFWFELPIEQGIIMKE